MGPRVDELVLRNRHPRAALDLRLLRRIVQAALPGLAAGPAAPEARYELAFFFIGSRDMADLNERYLRHTGSTDVITFGYQAPLGPDANPCGLCGDIFVCLDDARRQARTFGTTWQEEVVRYCVHGLLHLAGFDDREPRARQAMKRVENRLVRGLAARFPLRRLAGGPKV